MVSLWNIRKDREVHSILKWKNLHERIIRNHLAMRPWDQTHFHFSRCTNTSQNLAQTLTLNFHVNEYIKRTKLSTKLHHRVMIKLPRPITKTILKQVFTTVTIYSWKFKIRFEANRRANFLYNLKDDGIEKESCTSAFRTGFFEYCQFVLLNNIGDSIR